jgi:hypothetical protein
MRRRALPVWQSGLVQFSVMSDAMTIAAAGIQAGIGALSNAAANVVAAATPTPAAEATPRAPTSLPGYTLAYNPSAPFANLQDLVAVPNADMATEITGEIEAANGIRANLVVYRIASHLYKSLLDM